MRHWTKRAIVTGGLGFIGKHFVRHLQSEGWCVLVIDKQNYPAAGHDEARNFTYYPGGEMWVKDICDIDRIPDCDVIFNFAAESHVGNSVIDSDEFVRSNVLGVSHLLSLLIKKPKNIRSLPRFVQISTDEVYGSTDEGSFKEDSLLNPSNPYSATKAAADHMIMSFHRTHGIDFNIIRPTNNWGPGQYHEKLVPIVCRHILEGREIRLHDGGTPRRSWLHVEDTCRAVLAVFEEGKKNEIYNISGEVRSNLEIVKKIFATNPYPNEWDSLLNQDYKRPGQDLRYSVDDSKLREHTSWERQCSVDDDSLWEKVWQGVDLNRW